MTRIVTDHRVDASGLETLRQPIDDVVLETISGPDTFGLAAGPFDRYERRLIVAAGAEPSDGVEFAVQETIDYRLAIPVWRPLFAIPVQRRMRNRHTSTAWWLPPDRFSARAARVISFLAVLAIVSGYLGSLLSQTLSFAGEEFGADSSRQAFTAGMIRIGTPIAFAVMWVADRRGRRLLLLSSSLVACVLAAATALVPTLWAYALSQAVFRGLSTAMGLLIGIVAVEESPPQSRAFVVSVISLCGGLGSGMVVWAVPLAGTGVAGWRWIFALALIGVIPIAMMWRHLPETQRFAIARQQSTSTRGSTVMRQRLILLGATAFLFTIFAAPASTLNTDYLRTVHDFSPAKVSLFKVVTSTPIGIGVLVAGWLADRRGRKAIGAFGVITGVTFTVLEYNSGGASLWIFGTIGTILGGAVVPTLGVYGPELFGTIRRGRSNGIISMVGVLGSISGLTLGSWLLNRTGYGQTFLLLSIGPVIVAGLVLFVFPETARRTLEDINPEDAPLEPSA